MTHIIHPIGHSPRPNPAVRLRHLSSSPPNHVRATVKCQARRPHPQRCFKFPISICDRSSPPRFFESTQIRRGSRGPSPIPSSVSPWPRKAPSAPPRVQLMASCPPKTAIQPPSAAPGCHFRSMPSAGPSRPSLRAKKKNKKPARPLSCPRTGPAQGGTN